MAVKKDKAIRVVNNMPVGALGIDLLEGKAKVLRKPGASLTISPEDVWNLFNSCKLIQKGHLYIEDKEMRVELGLEEDGTVDANSLSKEDLKDMLNESSVQELKEFFKADLSDGTKEKIVLLAREQYRESSFDAKKMKVIETETGLSVAEIDGSDVEVVNDVKDAKVSRTNK